MSLSSTWNSKYFHYISIFTLAFFLLPSRCSTISLPQLHMRLLNLSGKLVKFYFKSRQIGENVPLKNMSFFPLVLFKLILQIFLSVCQLGHSNCLYGYAYDSTSLWVHTLITAVNIKHQSDLNYWSQRYLTMSAKKLCSYGKIYCWCWNIVFFFFFCDDIIDDQSVSVSYDDNLFVLSAKTEYF